MDFCRHVVYVKQNIPTLFLSAKIQLVLLSGAVYYIYLDFLSLGHCVKISIVFPRWSLLPYKCCRVFGYYHRIYTVILNVTYVLMVSVKYYCFEEKLLFIKIRFLVCFSSDFFIGERSHCYSLKYNMSVTICIFLLNNCFSLLYCIINIRTYRKIITWRFVSLLHANTIKRFCRPCHYYWYY